MNAPNRWLPALALVVGVGALVLGSQLLLGPGTKLTAQAPPSQTAEPEPPPPPVLLLFGPGTRAFERGWVTLTRQPRMRPTTVTIEMAPNVPGPQTATIWQGHCHDLASGQPLGDVKYRLTDVVGGESITTLPDSRSGMFNGSLALTIQGTTMDPAQYVACVDLPARHNAMGGGPGPRPPQ